MAILKRLGGAWAAAAIAAVLLVRPAAAQPQDVTVEDDVKAAYLFNFTKFIEWPPSAFSGQTDPLNVCVAGEPSVVRAVERILSGEHVEGRPLRAVSTLPETPAACHVLFVGRGGTDRAGRLLNASGSAPVLTVGDSARFLQQGGVIAFVVENRRVRFDISKAAADRAGLKVSSKLLRVARHVSERAPSR